jgi:hypothetical protein
MAAKSATSSRRAVAAESFKTAADCIGAVEHGMSLFAVTRGQFSMIDAILHVLDQVGPAKLSIWTWAIAEYELEQFTRLQNDGRITDGLLVIDHSARNRNMPIITKWQEKYGAKQVRYVHNHAKIATIETDDFRVLLRGSMNLNFNPRFEQLDVTEGGPDFDLVKEIESELPWLPNNCSHADVRKASRTDDAFDQQTLDLFAEVKTWAK